MKESKEKRGPKPERVKIEGDWEDAIDRAFEKKRPKKGWPKPDSQACEENSHSDDDSGDSKNG